MHTRAQGAIEYLLIIGAAILVVTIVVVAITSVLQASTGQANVDTAINAQKNLEYQNLGYSISVSPGTSQSYTLDVAAYNRQLGTIFANVPQAALISVNGVDAYEDDSWYTIPNTSTSFSQYQIKPGDTLSITNNSTQTISAKIKGTYALQEPIDVSITSPTESGTYSSDELASYDYQYTAITGRTINSCSLFINGTSVATNTTPPSTDSFAYHYQLFAPAQADISVYVACLENGTTWTSPTITVHINGND